jgi:NTP pyrophosphatase (non-canonical NTP hydrolase)
MTVIIDGEECIVYTETGEKKSTAHPNYNHSAPTTQENYIQQAMRTNSDTVGTYSVHPDLIHGALGLADELIELRQAMAKCDRVNALEEASDVCWFTALIASRTGIDPFEYPGVIGEDDPVETLEFFIGEVVSIIKRSYAYGKQLDTEQLEMHLLCIVDSVSVLAEQLGSSLDDVLELNIAKLSSRYPDRFTPELANNRDVDREREVLEQNT